MMNYQAILFDMDGTLLPMDFNEFTRGYFSLLAKTVAPLGYEKAHLIDSMWRGVHAMSKNEGPKKNDEVFWEVFSSLESKAAYDHIPFFDAFYENEFHAVKALTQPTPLAKKAVSLAKKKADRVVLATNPVFPEVAVRARLSWAGLSAEDFDLVTHYANSISSKPNPLYFENIARALGAEPSRCLMVGNNVEEDILPAQCVGMQTFLLTDCLMSKQETLPDTPKGSFDDLLAFLQSQ